MERDELLVSKVPRSLEMKSKLFGFELPDLLLVFFTLGTTNLLFGFTAYRYLLVWGTTSTLAAFLVLMKRGRPEKYIEHYANFISKPLYYAAGRPDRQYKKLERSNYVE